MFPRGHMYFVVPWEMVEPLRCRRSLDQWGHVFEEDCEFCLFLVFSFAFWLPGGECFFALLCTLCQKILHSN